MKEEAHLSKSTILANVLFYYCRQLQLPRSIHVEFYSHNGHWKKTIGRIWLIYSFPIFAWGAHNSYVTCISESPSNFLFQYRRFCGLLFIMFLSCCWSKPAVAGSQLALPSSGSPAVTKRKKKQSWSSLYLICAVFAKFLNNLPQSGSFFLDSAAKASTVSGLELFLKTKKNNHRQDSPPLAGKVIICNLLQMACIAANGSQATGLCRPNSKAIDNETE